MNKNRVVLFFFAIAFIVLFAPRPLAGQTGSNIAFTVSMPKPWTHLLEVEMRMRQAAGAESTELSMPVWTPGSYLVREFERNVQDFTAADSNGRTLSWEKTKKDTWRVASRGARDWRVTYRVYANELTVRTNELNSDHAFWNNAALLMYPAENLARTGATLRVVPPTGWKVATGLPAVPGQTNTFRAENFDILYDSPFEVSNFTELKFEVRGVPHRIVIDGEGNYDPVRLKSEVQKIVEAEVGMFGETPYHDYTFILHLRAATGGGLEHLNSTALGFHRFDFSKEDGYRRFDALVAHEFFHLWNVKRIRPDALGPFDYTNENYTRLLWVAEGITEYYGHLMLRRASLISDEEYLAHLAQQIEDFQNTPGRHVMSAEEASFDAWIKYYRPDENSVNSQISYYDKGELLGMLLDLEIRQRSKNAKSLDDVMRALYNDFFKQGRNYTPADFQRLCEAAAGTSLDHYFARYVRGTEELPYNEALNAAGVQLEQAAVPTVAYLGAEFEDSGDFVSVKNVRAGSPAYEQGLNAKDQIVAIDGARVNSDRLVALLLAKRPGDVIKLTVFRNEDLRTLQIKLGGRVDAPFRIVQLPSRSAQQKLIYDSWMHLPMSLATAR